MACSSGCLNAINYLNSIYYSSYSFPLKTPRTAFRAHDVTGFVSTLVVTRGAKATISHFLPLPGTHALLRDAGFTLPPDAEAWDDLTVEQAYARPQPQDDDSGDDGNTPSGSAAAGVPAPAQSSPAREVDYTGNYSDGDAGDDRRDDCDGHDSDNQDEDRDHEGSAGDGQDEDGDGEGGNRSGPWRCAPRQAEPKGRKVAAFPRDCIIPVATACVASRPRAPNGFDADGPSPSSRERGAAASAKPDTVRAQSTSIRCELTKAEHRRCGDRARPGERRVVMDRAGREADDI